MEITTHEQPIRHWVIDGWPLDLANALTRLPSADHPGWTVYANDCERKRAWRDVSGLPSVLIDALDGLLDSATVSEFQRLIGLDICGLVGDETLHGGGLHITDPGGYLVAHLDYALHPLLPQMERRLNAILFLDDWQEAWGGALCFYDDMGREVVSRIYPQRGRIVLWEPSDVAYHGCEPVTGPQSRHTIAVYYLAPARPGITRKRALFVPHR